MSSTDRSSEYGVYGVAIVVPRRVHFERTSAPVLTSGPDALLPSPENAITSTPSLRYAPEWRIRGTQVRRNAFSAATPTGPDGHAAAVGSPSAPLTVGAGVVVEPTPVVPV